MFGRCAEGGDGRPKRLRGKFGLSMAEEPGDMVRERRALAMASRLVVLVDGAKEGVVLPLKCGGREKGGWGEVRPAPRQEGPGGCGASGQRGRRPLSRMLHDPATSLVTSLGTRQITHLGTINETLRNTRTERHAPT